MNLMVSIRDCLPSSRWQFKNKLLISCFKLKVVRLTDSISLSLLPSKGKLCNSVHVVLFHVCYCEIAHIIIKKNWKGFFFNFGTRRAVYVSSMGREFLLLDEFLTISTSYKKFQGQIRR